MKKNKDKSREHPFVRFINRFASWVDYVGVIILLVLIVFTVIGIICRYFLGFCISGRQEASRYFLPWITLLGASTLAWRGNHVRIDFLYNHLPDKIQKAGRIFQTSAYILIAAIFTYTGYMYTKDMVSVSPTLDIPMQYVYSAIPIGGGILTFVYIAVLIRHILSVRNRKSQK